MDDSSRTKTELIEEISALRKRIQELELSEAGRKRVEEELVVSRNRLSRAEIISRCGNWEFDLGSNLVFASDGARSIYGVLDRDWTIEEVQKIPLPEYRDMLDEALRELINEDRPYSVGFKIRRPDTGEVIDIYSVAEYDRRRNVVFGIVQDITVRTRAEEALLESEAKYRTVVESSLVGVYIIQDGLFRFVNRRWCEIYGYAYDEIVDKVSPLDLTPPEDKRLVEESFRKRLSGEAGNMEYEVRAIRKDGGIITVKILGSLMLYKGLPAISGTLYDITDQERAEEQVRRKTALLEAQVNASLDGIIVVDKGKKVLQNQQVIDLLKIPRHIAESDDDEAQVEWVKGMVKNPERFQEKVAYMFAHPGETMRDELELKDGTVLDTYSSRVIGKDGQRYGRIWTFRDTTERKRSEEERARLESQLFRAQKMEAIGTLAGGVAHDFNNILTVITGYSTLMKMEMGQDNPMQAYVEYIISSAEKAAHLTQSLLSFSRQQPIVLTHIDMNESIRSVEKLLKRLLTENIVIRTLLAPHDVTIMADATQIDQIVFNLATNARDAMPEGGVLTIETKAVELDEEFHRCHGYGEPGRYALLSISDTGVGLDEAVRERIFDPFFTTKEAGKGTGLGLSTVYGIVKQHNGFITIYSEPDMGTVFHIYLPAVSKADDREKPAPVPVERGKETILVAEDNEAVRDLICRVLTEYGYTTVEAVDGAEAIERFRGTDQIDLLILDSVMPKKSGREAYNAIREIAPNIKVIFTSGYTRDVILDKGIEDRQFAFISKPVSPGALLQKVREVLDE